MTIRIPDPTVFTDTSEKEYMNQLTRVLRLNFDSIETEIANSSSGVTDGDKGDVTVSSLGTVWSVDNGLDATKIADGSVSNTEFQYLDGVTSNIQDQIDSIVVGSSDSFKTIAVSGQSSIVADSPTDTLTIVAGSNISLTTDASTDTLTITSTAGTNATTITVADTTDTSTYVALFEDATGNLAPKTDAGLTYNASTASISATNFIGNLTGNASTVTTNANLTGVITSVGNATSIASQTGTGSKFVVDNSPTLITPTLGVASATSINKVTITTPATASTLTINDGKTLTVTNDASVSGTNTGDQTITLTGDVTGSGTGSFATSIADNSVTLAKMEHGTQGDILYYGSSGTPTRLGYGTSGYVLTTKGSGQNPAWEAASGGVTDGDKGDITVSSSGTVWTVDNKAITYAKIQDVSATDKLLGRSTAGSGVIEEITCTAAGRALLDDTSNVYQRETLGISPGINNYTASVDPTTSDSSNNGYYIGSVWFNNSTLNAFVCVDSSAYAGIWLPIALYGSGLNNYTATTDPTVNNDSTQGYSVGSIWINVSQNYGYICHDNSVGAAKWYFITLPNGAHGDITTASLGGNLTLNASAITGKDHKYPVTTDMLAITNTSEDSLFYAYVYDLFTLFKSQANQYSKTQSFTTKILTDAATISWNLEEGQVAEVTLAGNRVMDTPTNIVDGATYILRVKQDAAGNRTLNLTTSTAFDWGTAGAPTLSTGANKIDYINCIGRGTTKLDCVFMGGYSG